MQICLLLDATRLYRWHVWLIDALAAPDREIIVQLAAATRPLPRCCALLFQIERLIYGLAAPCAVDPAGEAIKPFVKPAGAADAPFDLMIDLAGVDCVPPAARRVLTPCFEGVPGETGAIACLARDTVPAIEVHDTDDPGNSWIARPALVDHEIFVRALDNILSGTVVLLKKAANADIGGVARPPSRPDPMRRGNRRPIASEAALRVAVAITRKMVRLLEAIAKGGKAWAVAWRPAAPGALLGERTAAFSVMGDDGRRYYADPFGFAWSGRRFLFVEEYSYATGRGCIAVSEINENGSAGMPRPVLEEPFHLSYPFVFEQDGEIWMIPESGDAGGVYLYRCEQFPCRWKREACLIGGRQAYDATLLRHGGLFWLFACEREWNSSSWDVLTLFRSESLAGVWQPHPQNPVLLDAATSRPAGAVFRRGGDAIRPVQDCTRFYGGAVLLCRIDRLTAEDFSQTTVGRIHCGIAGCHTYNSAAGIEVIDVFARRGRSEITAFYDPAAPIARRAAGDILFHGAVAGTLGAIGAPAAVPPPAINPT